MQPSDLRHRLVAILEADGVGYSRLMSVDERATVRALDAAREVFRSHIVGHGGRIIDTAGDSVLAVFETATGAVSAGLAVQQQLAEASLDVPEERRLRFRIGIHLGDVFEKPDGTVYGDGVNIAARLEGLAEPGGVAVSQSVQTAVQGHVSASFEDIGEQSVKNIAQPVRVFRLHTGADPASRSIAAVAPQRRKGLTRAATIGGVLAATAIASALINWHSLRNNGTPAPTEAAPSAPAGIASPKTIAVLAFANLSDDKANEYFADGVSDELINILSRVQGLRVTARNSSFYFKGKVVAMADLARQLGVTYLVDGSVRKAGERVRIAAQLVHASDGAVLWSQTFDRDFKDVLAVQSELGLAIASSLKLPLDAAGLAGSGTTNAQAWQMFLQATRKPEGQREDHYRQALALDPSFAQVYLGLADESFISGLRGGDRKDARARSVNYLNEALRIDPRSAQAYGRLASAESLLDDMDAVRRNAQRALELDPNEIAAQHWMAVLSLEAGRMDEALAARKALVELDPLELQPRVDYAYLLILANRAALALATIDQALALYPNDPDGVTVRSVALLQLGRRDEALAIARRQGYVKMLALAGNSDDRAALQRRTDLDVHDAAWLALARGRHDAFIDHLKMHVHDVGFRWRSLFDPAFDPIRKLPGFKAWLEKCHLTAAHERAQAWRAANPVTRASRA